MPWSSLPRQLEGPSLWQLKRLYREIRNFEIIVKQEDSMDDSADVMGGRVVLKGKEVENDNLEKEK